MFLDKKNKFESWNRINFEHFRVNMKQFRYPDPSSESSPEPGKADDLNAEKCFQNLIYHLALIRRALSLTKNILGLVALFIVIFYNAYPDVFLT